jgi:uncharacterized OB-fold protein
MTPEKRREANRRQRERYHRRLEEGICPLCGENPLAPGMKSCPSCRAYYNAQTRMREKAAKRWKARYFKAVVAGRCPRCGRPSDGAHTYCAACREKYRLNAARKRKEKKHGKDQPAGD